jgi:hypothetical protein
VACEKRCNVCLRIKLEGALVGGGRGGEMTSGEGGFTVANGVIHFLAR